MTEGELYTGGACRMTVVRSTTREREEDGAADLDGARAAEERPPARPPDRPPQYR